MSRREVRALLSVVSVACSGASGQYCDDISNAFPQQSLMFAVGDSPDHIAIGDVNGDRVPDLVAANTTDRDLSVLLGLGDGRFEHQRRYTVGTFQPSLLKLADMSGDGALDIVVSGAATGREAVLLVNDGAGGFAQRIEIVEPLGRLSEVAVGDIDADGDNDIVYAAASAGLGILLNEPEGQLTFQQPNSFLASANVPRLLRLADLNDDGALDIVFVPFGSIADRAPRLGLNDGTGNFTESSQFPITIDLQDNSTLPRDIIAADLTGDGRADFGWLTSEGFQAYRQETSGGFLALPPIEFPATGSGGIPRSAAVANLTGDSLPDILIDTTNGVLSYFGIGVTFIPTTPFGGQRPSQTLAVADLDGDGTDDLVTGVKPGGLDNDFLSVSLNDGLGNTASSTTQSLPSESTTFAFADVIGDERPEIVCLDLTDGGISVLAQGDDGNFTHAGQSDFDASFDVFGTWDTEAIEDVNGDGRADIVLRMQRDRVVLVLENAGDGTFAESLRLNLNDTIPYDVKIDDFDGDGFADFAVVSSRVLGSNGSEDGVRFLLAGPNRDFSNGFFYTLPPQPNGGFAFDLVAGDLNSDGLPDLIAGPGSTSQDGLSTHVNNGDMTFSPLQEIFTDTQIDTFAFVDLDSDNVEELVFAESSGLQVWETAPTGLLVPIDTYDLPFGADELTFGDLNADGLTDICANATRARTLSLLINEGDGTFEPAYSIASPGLGTIGILDFDLDGSPDITSLSSAGAQALLGQPFELTEWTGQAAASQSFGDAANWSSGVPGPAGPNAAVFDANSGPTVVALSETTEIDALGVISGSLDLDLAGMPLTIGGIPRPGRALSLDIGAARCGEPSPGDATLRLSNSGSQQALLRMPRLTLGRFPAAMPGSSSNVVIDNPAALTMVEITSGFDIGLAPGSTSVVDVRGSKTRIEYGDPDRPTANFNVGVDGAGMVYVSDGASFRSVIERGGAFTLGRDPFGVGVVTADGSGSRLAHRGREITIGGAGLGHLSITDGASFLSDASERLEVAAAPGSVGVVSIFGGIWENIGEPIFVNSGGTIEGDGVITSSFGLFNGGRIRPELRTGGPAELILFSSYSQQDRPDSPRSSGVLEIDVFSGSEVVADFLRTIFGSASLGGGLAISASPGTYPAGSIVEIMSANSIDPNGAAFDVVTSPVVTVDDAGTLTQGIFVSVVDTDSNRVSLEVVTLEDLLLGTAEFAANGPPNDAVLGDVTGDGIDDLVIATPTLDGNPRGFVALLEGVDSSNGFTFSAVSLYANPAEVDSPIAVEIGDYDNDGVNEVAFASRGDAGVTNDLFVLEVVGGVLTDSPADAIAIPADAVASDLVTLNGPDGEADMLTGIVRNTVTVGGRVIFSELTGVNWASCDIPVDPGQPDSGDPIDVDALTVDPSADEPGQGLVVTIDGSDDVIVFVPDDPDPAQWSPIVINAGSDPGEVRAGDLDGDGQPEIVVANEAAATLSVIRNISTTGDVSFAPPVEVHVSETPVSLTLADIDDDGDRDIVIVATEDNSQVVQQLRNTSTGAGTISLAGAESLADQPSGRPVLVRSADLDNSNPVGLADDVVILIDPDAQQNRGSPAMHGVRLSEPARACLADVNGDGTLNGADFNAWLTAFSDGDQAADQNEDGALNGADFNAWLQNFTAGCLQ